MTASRDIAYQALIEHRQTGLRASEVLERVARTAERDDVRFASEIVHTCVRRRRTLNTILAAFVKRPAAQVEPDLWSLLQIGVCQIVLLETAAHAAVHETVNTGRRLGNRRWSGFLNGTLRGVARAVDTDVPPDTIQVPAANLVPLSTGYRTLKQELFPDPSTDFCGYIGQAFGYPDWLVRRWLDAPEGEALRIARWFNNTPPISLRINRLRTSQEDVLTGLAARGVAVEKGIHPAAVRLVHRCRIPELPGFDAGAFAVQDESAMAAASLLDPQPGARVLDLCAGSGSKTCHLAEIMNNTGQIVAVDNNAARLSRLSENTDRLGIHIIESRCVDALSEHDDDGFDSAMVDVPCSNTGVLGRRPEVRWRLKPAEFPELARLQYRLLERAVQSVRSGGRIVYSTCSIDPVENEKLIRSFVSQSDTVDLSAEHLHSPGRPGDGAYQALLLKRDS